MDEDETKTKVDPRMSWVTSTITTMCSHLKKDKIEKGLNSKDGKTIVDDFLDGDHPLLLINGDSGAPTIELPERLPKNKWFYILKKDVNSALPSEKIADAVTIGEMCADPLEHMERVVREIYIPQIQNQVNQGFGEVEYKEIMIRLNSFLASVSITLGQTKGETCLPLPPLGVAEPGDKFMVSKYISKNRRVRKSRRIVWYQYLDAKRKKNYYYEPKSKQTVWKAPTGVTIKDGNTNKVINNY